jgi:glyoxylase-like metal-dependent hydrolase (beta-lactamase superfamily II)
MRTMAIAGGLAWLMAAAAQTQAEAQTPPPASLPAPLVKPEDLTRVSPHVQVIPDNSVRLVSNIGFIVGDKAVMVVDTGLGPRNGATVAAVAQRLAPGKAVYLVATHAHPEHDLGAQAFPAGSTMIRSEAQAADRDNDMAVAKTFAAGSPAAAELLAGAVFRQADVLFKDEATIDLGGVLVTLAALGPAHTAGDIAVFVEGEKVLFSGDLAMKAQPAITNPAATLATWRHALDVLEGFGPVVVVPSHGPLGDAGYIKGYRAYLNEVAARTKAAKAGGASQEAATEAVWRAMQDRYPDRGRLAGAVRTAYQGG